MKKCVTILYIVIIVINIFINELEYRFHLGKMLKVNAILYSVYYKYNNYAFI